MLHTLHVFWSLKRTQLDPCLHFTLKRSLGFQKVYANISHLKGHQGLEKSVQTLDKETPSVWVF